MLCSLRFKLVVRARATVHKNSTVLWKFQVKARVKSLAFGPIRRAHALSVRLRHRDTRPLRHAPALQLKLRCAEGWALRE